MRTGTNCSKILWFCLFRQLALLAEPISAGEPPPRSSGLVQQSRAATFEIVLGRLTMDSCRYAPMKREACDEINGEREFLCVSATFGRPSLHYSSHSDHGRLTIDIADATQLTIEQTVIDSGKTTKLQFFQPHAGPMRLILSRESEVKIDLKAASLWHFYAQHADICNQWMSPVICRLVRDFEPREHLLQVNVMLQQQLGRELSVRREIVSSLVSELGSDSKEKRVLAQQSMLAIGVSVLPLVDEIKPANLNEEQKRRLESIRRKLRPFVSDRPEALACWLSADFEYWNTVAAQWPTADRLAASEHVRMVCGKPLPGELTGEPVGPVTRVATRQSDRR